MTGRVHEPKKNGSQRCIEWKQWWWLLSLRFDYGNKWTDLPTLQVIVPKGNNMMIIYKIHNTTDRLPASFLLLLTFLGTLCFTNWVCSVRWHQCSFQWHLPRLTKAFLLLTRWAHKCERCKWRVLTIDSSTDTKSSRCEKSVMNIRTFITKKEIRCYRFHTTANASIILI